MQTYTISRKPETLDWSKIPSVSINNPLHKKEVDISATAQLCYDEQSLVVRLAAKESDIRAEYTNPLDQPCEDSCLEFFFSPMEGDNRYINIELNPNCCMYLGIGSSIDNLIRMLPEGWDPFNAKAERTSDGWELTYQIPFSFIKFFFPEFSVSSGKTIRGNFYKCGDLTKEEHYFTWNQITGDVISFHRPCDFGLLIFE
jgi:hypothetical protein